MDDLSDEDAWLAEHQRPHPDVVLDEWAQHALDGYDADLPPGYSISVEPDDDGYLEFFLTCGGETHSGGSSGIDRESVGWKLRELQGELIEHEFGYGWPRCPSHGSHPLRAAEDGWHCPATGSHDVWEYGSLARVPVAPEPDRADGEVRWFLADLGWGVIAHCDGDLWVHFSQIDGVGYRSLDDGEPVTFDVASPRQAKFRRADNVRRISRLEGLV